MAAVCAIKVTVDQDVQRVPTGNTEMDVRRSAIIKSRVIRREDVLKMEKDASAFPASPVKTACLVLQRFCSKRLLY